MMRGKLAIRAPNWVGDLVMSTAVLDAARGAGFQEIIVFVRASLAAVLADAYEQDAPAAASLTGSRTPVRVVPVANDREEVRVYRAERPDAVLLLSNSFGAAWRAWRAGVPVRAGAALSGRRSLLTHVVVPPTRAGRRVPIPTAHLLRDVAGLLGILVPDLHPRLCVRTEIIEREAARLERLGLAVGSGYVLCCPGAAFGAAKLWPPERFAHVLDQLHAEFGWRGVVTGGPGEEPLCAEVARFGRSGIVSLEGERRDLEGLKALVRGARMLIVGDSGPRWYAAAFDVPCVSVMGPNFPELTATALERARVVRLDGLECAPCLERVCPLGHHRCLRDLGVEPVLQAARELITDARAAELRPLGRA